MKGFLIVPFVLAALSGCADGNSGSQDMPQATGQTFKMVHPKPTNNGKVGNPTGGNHASGRMS
jgi:hypothetical protein